MKFYTVIILLIYLINIFPQSKDDLPRCLTSEYNQYISERLPDYQNKREKFEKQIQRIIAEGQEVDNFILIPVVVHVVWHDPLENISDEQILSQLVILNQDFYDHNIQFFLAFKDPEGNPTTGITRTYSNIELFERDQKGNPSQAMKLYPTGKIAWPRDQYLNIWTCNLDALGFAQYPPDFPGTTPPYDPETDGVVIHYGAFGNTGTLLWPGRYDRGKTCTHEVGHWFALIHTWGDAQGCFGTDYVEDTNPCADEYYSRYPTCLKPVQCYGLQRMTENYMDYSDDGCFSSFTQGQINRMRAAIELSRPTFYSPSILVDQKLSTSFTVGNISRWVQDFFTPYNAPIIIKNPSSTEILKGDHQIYSNEKYHNWRLDINDLNDIINHHIFSISPSPTEYLYTSCFYPTYPNILIKNNFEKSELNPAGDYIQFKDPWLIDYPDPLFDYTIRNRGMKETGPDALIFKNRPSPFYPDYNTSYNGNTYKGVFLDQDYNIPGNPYYSVQTTSPQNHIINGRNHTFYFQNWTKNNTEYQDSNALSTGVVFKSQNSSASAIFKGTELTNNASAFQNNGQRKIATYYDEYNSETKFKVYESLGKVFLEKSTDGGSTWEIFNGETSGMPLSASESKNPSLDYIVRGIDAYLLVTYQEKYNNEYRIKLECFDLTDPGLNKLFSEYLYTSSGNYSNNSNPVICLSNESDGVIILTVWKESSGFYCSGALIEEYTGNVQWMTYEFVQGTSSASSNPSVDSYSNYSAYAECHLVYQENSTIKYKKIIVDPYQGYSWSDTEVVSYGGGYPNNYSPVITVTTETYPGIPRVVWISDDWGQGDYSAMYRERSSVMHNNWTSAIYSYPCGDMVNTTSVSINRTEINEFIIAWAEADGYMNKYVTSYDLGSVNSSTNGGKYIQLSDGYELGNWSSGIDMCVQKNSSAPYFLNTQKIYDNGDSDFLSFSSGRKGVLVKADAEFYFEIGNLLLNNNPVGFRLTDDSTGNINIAQLNGLLTTNSFNIKNNDVMEFSITFGVKDSVAAFNCLAPGDYITAGVQLIDKSTGSAIGNYHQYTLRRNAILKKSSLAFRVNLNNVGEKEVELRLNLSTNIQLSCILEEVITEHSILGKMNVKELNADGSELVKEYALFQNYPNPFNPSTVINYEIPEDGFITIKIYDMLGKEISTLVNEYKSTGRYQTEFDASNLSSGIYIYRIQAGEYSASRKMTLIK